MRIEIYPAEVEALRLVDRTYREYQRKKQEPEKTSLADQLADVKAAAEEKKRQMGTPRGR